MASNNSFLHAQVEDGIAYKDHVRLVMELKDFLDETREFETWKWVSYKEQGIKVYKFWKKNMQCFPLKENRQVFCQSEDWIEMS